MRTQTIVRNLYTFEELSEEAQENAMRWYLEGEYDYHPLFDEAFDSLKEFLDFIPGASLGRHEISVWGHSYVDVDYEPSYDFDPDEMMGVRAATYIQNNWLRVMHAYKGRRYLGHVHKAGEPDQRPEIKSHPMVGRYSYGHGCKCWFASVKSNVRLSPVSEISLTGVYTDYSLLKPLEDFLKSPKSDLSLKDVLDECVHGWLQSVLSDMEYHQSEEYARESILANEYEFDEDGNIA